MKSNNLLTTICLMIMCIVVVSCNSAHTPESTAPAEDVDRFKSYPIDVNASKTDFAEVVESVELMRLEETEASLLSYIDRIYEYQGGYVFRSGRNGEIFNYAKDGRYLSKINRKGDGPEEYSNITSLWLEKGQICVYTSGKSIVNCYDFQGQAQRYVKLETNGSQVEPFAGGYVMDKNGRATRDTLLYHVVALNKKFEIDSLLLPFTSENQIGISTTVNGFAPYKSGLSYLRTMTDTIYYLDEEGIAPMIHFDFGNDWLWKEEGLISNGQEAVNAMQNRGKTWNLNALVHERWAYMVYYTSFQNFEHVLLDRYSGTTHTLNLNIDPEERYNLSATQWMGDRLLMTIESEKVASFLAELEDSQWQFRDGTNLEAIESSEHRVLMWVKFKEK